MKKTLLEMQADLENNIKGSHAALDKLHEILQKLEEEENRINNDLEAMALEYNADTLILEDRWYFGL